MTPIDWAKRPIQKYADFSGRAPRAEYWWFILAVVVAYVVVTIVESILGINRMVAGVYGPIAVALMLGTLVPSIAVAVRRLHDTNRSGWWILLPVVPYCLAFVLGGAAMMNGGGMTGLGVASIFLLIGAGCALLLLIFYVLPGTAGDNGYGPDPYAGQN
ncbi:MAG TPA: DUF805 domain-containing protein [Sphingomicrobium sp.]|nr:DUF805 domain-containing protein [Sphingomicrobium sp.]